MTDEAKPDLRDEERKAIDLIARTPEGRLLHRYLRRLLEAVTVAPEASALQRHEGIRILARDLMAIMADGIEATNGGHTDKPLVTSPGAVRTGRAHRTVRDYLAAEHAAGDAEQPRRARRGRAARLRTD